ncbi:MAG: acylase [Gammaproteobacteria bacterium]
MNKRTLPPVLALSLACAALTGCSNDSSDAPAKPNPPPTEQPSKYEVEIRRTAHGIPHIKANDAGSMAYGVALAYAQDNFCVLANEFLTVNGERSKYFGPTALGGNKAVPNLQTDYFYKLINDEESVKLFWTRQPAESRALIEGYVAGYNRYLADTGVSKLAEQCRNGAWVRPITNDDMVKLMRRYAAEAGAGQFIASIVGAAPPGPATATGKIAGLAGPIADPMTPAYWEALHNDTGSNGVALGKDATANGQGMLLGNPHFPWQGALRFYQLHLTIPGKLDVMGASLAGLPVVNIGFNENVAWTHTVNTSAHFTAHLLQLDPSSPTRYLVDGKPVEMNKRTISIDVKNADGSVSAQTRDFYSTPLGYLGVIPGKLDWTTQTAYTIHDANLDNHRLIEQWSAMNRAKSIDELRDAIDRIVGLPWVNTLATDKAGNALYMDVTAVPNVSAAKQAQCVPAPFKPLAAQGIFVLAGSNSACNWTVDPAAPQPGIFAGSSLPRLQRSDFVQNSNDSAWMSNPAQPLTGFADIVSRDNLPLGPRTRIGITQLQRRLAGSDGLAGNKMTLAQLQQIVLSNRVYMADQTVDDLLTLCNGPKDALSDNGTPVDLTTPCAQLAAWDRTANLNANIGYGYFTATFDRIRALPDVWAVPFNPLDPVNTPRGLNVANPSVNAAIRTAFASAVLDARAGGWTDTTVWGDLQGTSRAAKWIPIHGGLDRYGVYNQIDSGAARPGKREVVHGTSYLQTVSFEAAGPHVEAILSYSQSTDPASPWYADQTELFSQKKFVTLPFTEQQITSDAAYTKTIVKGN